MGRACSSIWRASCAGGRCRIGGCAPVMVSGWSLRLRSGPKIPRARHGSGRWTEPWSSAVGGGACMCRQPGRCGCAVGGCLPIPKATPWPSAGGHWVKGGWRRLSYLTGRARARPGVRSLGSVVRSVGSGWCARPSSPGPEPPHQQRQSGSRSHEGERDRGRLEADLERRSLPCRGSDGAYCETMRATISSPATDLGANSPRGRRRCPPDGAPPGWDHLPSSRALEAVAPHSVGGPSNQALMRTAAGSEGPLSMGLAAA
jgi:hypothetical protein